MRVQVLQHVPFEDIGSIASWLDACGATAEYTRFYADAELPSPADVDLVIAMGGPMSVNDEGRLSWLRAEKEFLRAVIGRGTRVLGICLGAQLISNAMGARVYPCAAKEIGWLPIAGASPNDSATSDHFRFPDEALVFQWHGEMFDLPPGAVRLAKSAACENQAFQIGRHVIALQFHLETTPLSAAAILENCRDELVPGPWIQSEAAIRAADASRYAAANALMVRVLNYLTDQPGHELPCHSQSATPLSQLAPSHPLGRAS